MYDNINVCFYVINIWYQTQYFIIHIDLQKMVFILYVPGNLSILFCITVKDIMLLYKNRPF